ncbi:unnamed protein product, partial [Discosporangium mesarthrocarpum]
VTHLGEVKRQFKIKYGSQFVRGAEENSQGCVNQTIIEKLRIGMPS